MLEMLRAHGLNAGPAQRPLLAGALAGVLADVPALVLLQACGALPEMAAAAAHPTGQPAAALLHAAVMLLGGIGYGQLFQRAANDRRGGWLLGMAYGFLLWMVVPVPLLQWLPPWPLMVGLPAAGLFLGQLLWGLALGIAFPYVHRPLQAGLEGRRPAALSEGGGLR